MASTAASISFFGLKIGDSPKSLDNPEPPLSQAIIIDWTTALEENTLGFNVYRSNTSESGMQKINQDRINSKVFGTSSGASYHFVDNTALPGMFYTYYLAEVTTGGSENIVSQATIYDGNIYLPLMLK